MYISRTLTSDPLKSIGDAFGGRDHGTVIHACKQVENMMEQDGSVKRGVDYLIKQLSKERSEIILNKVSDEDLSLDTDLSKSYKA